MASSFGHSSVVSLLIEAHCNVNLQNDVSESVSTLHAQLRGNIFTVPEQNKASALAIASAQGHTSIVKALIEAHVDLNQQDFVSYKISCSCT